MQIEEPPAPTFFGVHGEWMQTPPPSWEDVAWLRKQWDGPFMVKGITRVDEAGIDSALMGLCRSVADLSRDEVLIPDGFACTLGTG